MFRGDLLTQSISEGHPETRNQWPHTCVLTNLVLTDFHEPVESSSEQELRQLVSGGFIAHLSGTWVMLSIVHFRCECRRYPLSLGSLQLG